MRASILLLPLFLFTLAPTANAWDLALVAGLNSSHPSMNPDPPSGTTLSSKRAFDFGALTTFQLSDDYYFETGLLRHSRTTILESATASTESSYSGWLVPLTFRFMRAPFFGFGFGPYLAFPQKSANAPNRKDSEIGLRVNLRIAVPAYREVKVIADASYLFGFTDLNKSAVAEDKTQDLLFLVGLQIPFGRQDAQSTNTYPAMTPDAESPETLAPKASPIPAPKKKSKKEKRK